MCIVADRSHLSKTRIVSGKYQNETTPDFMKGFTDLLLYSNDAKSEVPHNCMLLPIPADVVDVQVFDGTPYLPLIEDLENVFPVMQTKSLTRSAKGVEVRQERVGMYDVSYISVNDLEEVCKKFPFKIQKDMISFLGNQYSEWTIVLCAWKGMKPLSSQPIAIKYNSAFTDDIYVPMMDGHGNVPERGKVDRNHKIAIAAQGWTGDYQLNTMKAIGFSSFGGDVLEDDFSNGDMFIPLDSSKVMTNEIWNKFCF